MALASIGVRRKEMQVINQPMPPVPRDQVNRLFFSCVIYETAEIERLLALPVLPRYRRIAYVWLFDWLSPAIRDRLGFR